MLFRFIYSFPFFSLFLFLCFCFVFFVCLFVGVFFSFRHLLIVGNLKMLSCNTVWGKVIEHCQGKKLSSFFVKTSIHLQEREMAINVKDNLLTVFYRSKRHFSHRSYFIPQSKGFPGGLCHSQDFMKKWRQENNDISEGKSRQFANYFRRLRRIEDKRN